MEEDVHRYHGTDIEVTYDSNRCIHVRECVEGLPAVFDTDERPWVDPDEADADAVAEVVERCPTGALHYERPDGSDETPPPNAVLVADDGPLYLRGDVELRTPAEETVLEDTRVGLCRCGHSENKPLCDGSHDRVFEADGLSPEEVGAVARADADDAADDGADGRLTVTLTEDGPFQLDGEFDLAVVDGNSERQDGATLCRCGHSDDKPFCDGTHAAVGFTTDPGE